jgi:Sap, sulfolipid-1-addressing protein
VDLPILPLAGTMVAGPQEMTAIVFVTHPTAVRVSVAFLAGAAVAVLLGTTIAYMLAGTIDLGLPADKGSTGAIIQYVLVALLAVVALRLAVVALRTYRHRERVEPPKWLGGLLEASPRKVLMMGFLLLLVFPTDLATLATVGVHLQHNRHALIDAAPFWGLTLLIAAIPLLTYLLFRRRAERLAPKVRDWMGTNSWLVNILVLGLFIVLILT